MAIGVGAALLLAGAVFAVVRLSGDGEAAGGADSPEAAAGLFLAALENEDALGVVDVMLPGERETFRDPMIEFLDELRRLEVVDEDASWSAVQGVDLVIDDETIEAETTNVDDIVNVTLAGSATVTVDGESLPIGQLIRDYLPDDADLSEADVDGATDEFGPLPLTAVREDGRWYLSAFYSVAEQARQSVDVDGEPPAIPAEGLVPSGGDSPEDAFDAVLDASAALDLGGLIAALNPDEFAALQRYAPIFLDDAQRELDVVDFEMHLDDALYDTSVDGDTASIMVSYLAGQMTLEGESVTFTMEDGCAVFEAQGQAPVNSCELSPEDPTLALPPELAGPLDEAATAITEAFADFQGSGVTMKRVDGTWYVSPMATGADVVLGVLRALDREEIDDLVSTLGEVGREVIDEFNSGEMVIPGVPPVVEPVPAPGEPTTDPTDPCWEEPTGSGAADCFAALVDQGVIDATEVPVELRAPECGFADVYWSGELYSLDDAAFTAAIEKAAPCFAEQVAAGTISAYELPPELADPSCLEGRNLYNAFDDEAYIDRVYDCAYD